MKIRICYHIVAQNVWEDITDNCINKMKKSGLWDKATEIHLMCHYTPHLFDNFKNKFIDDKRIVWHMFTNSVITRGESFTNAKVKEICDLDTEEYAVLRLHNKSSNHVGEPLDTLWRDLIEYWNIDRWDVLYNKLLDGYDVAGNDWRDTPWPHFSGNVWWAKSSYIKTLPYLTLPTAPYSRSDLWSRVSGYFTDRHESEAWVGLSNPTHWSAYPELTDWCNQTMGIAYDEHWLPNKPFNNKEIRNYK